MEPHHDRRECLVVAIGAPILSERIIAAMQVVQTCSYVAVAAGSIPPRIAFMSPKVNGHADLRLCRTPKSMRHTEGLRSERRYRALL
jgi:hypothetical protein